MGNKVKVTVIATGFDDDNGQEQEASLRPRLGSMRQSYPNPLSGGETSAGGTGPSSAVSELEVPAFLRTKAIE